MSDPATNSEIEDVLSSIRRLVSGETRKAPALAVEAEKDKLVLTPALRVEPKQEARPVADEPVAEDTAEVPLTLMDPIEEPAQVETPAGDSAFAGRSELEAKIAELEALISGQSSDWEPDEGDEQATALPLRADEEPDVAEGDDDGAEEAQDWQSEETAAWADPAEDVQVEEPEADEQAEADESFSAEQFWSEDDGAADPQEDHTAEDDEDYDAAEDVAAEGDETVDEWSVEEDQSDDAEAWTTEEDAVEDADEWAAEESVDDHQFDAEDSAPVEEAASAISLVKAVVQNADPEPEEMDESRDEPVATTQTEHHDDAGEEFEDDVFADHLFADDDSPILDEEMLREMVAEIVRQELQGALGERVTRNVRKLVRREIHRALASLDLG